QLRRDTSAPSIASSRRFTSSPPAYPTSAPFDPTTRWQGTTIGIGFAFSAPPAARDAFSLPARRATDRYVLTAPNGIFAVASRIRRWNGERPDRSTSTSNDRRVPLKYCSSSRARALD